MEFDCDTIKSWLEDALADYGIVDLAVELEGKTGKGDGYTGDVLFVHMTGYQNGGKIENYLVLKCSKSGDAFRKTIPVRDCYLNEIYFYEKILPAFNRFEREHHVKEPFSSVPKFYGKYVSDSIEVLVLENLKKVGYDMWDSLKPLSRKHLELIVEEYAKFHAISVAMRDQQPQQYHKLCDGLINAWLGFLKTDVADIFSKNVEWTSNFLQDIVDESILTRLLDLKDRAFEILTGTELQTDALKVIIDCDCWVNNYMHRLGDGVQLPPKVALIDWQIVMVGSPIFDLSYSLFAAISKEDIENMNVILEHYYNTFANYVRQLGSDPVQLYPFKQFLAEWKLYGKYGLLLSNAAIKAASTSKDKTVDFNELAEQGQVIADVWMKIDVFDPLAVKNRLQYIIEYAADHDLF